MGKLETRILKFLCGKDGWQEVIEATEAFKRDYQAKLDEVEEKELVNR